MNSEYGEPGSLSQVWWGDTLRYRITKLVEDTCHDYGIDAQTVWADVVNIAEQSQITTE